MSGLMRYYPNLQCPGFSGYAKIDCFWGWVLFRVRLRSVKENEIPRLLFYPPAREAGFCSVDWWRMIWQRWSMTDNWWQMTDGLLPINPSTHQLINQMADALAELTQRNKLDKNIIHRFTIWIRSGGLYNSGLNYALYGRKGIFFWFVISAAKF